MGLSHNQRHLFEKRGTQMKRKGGLTIIIMLFISLLSPTFLFALEELYDAPRFDSNRETSSSMPNEHIDAFIPAEEGHGLWSACPDIRRGMSPHVGVNQELRALSVGLHSWIDTYF